MARLLSSISVASLLLVLLVLLPACFGESAPPAAPEAVRLPPALGCEAGLGPSLTAAPADNAPPPMAGQMTAQAADAKRLFDAEKWNDAVVALQIVWTGRSGDDEGNRDLAQYHMAIALYRLKRVEEAVDVFRDIAKKRTHLKHNETLLWLSKYVTTRPDLLELSDFSAYAETDVSRFDNANQQAIYFTLVYMLGRERLAEGKLDEGRALLTRATAEESSTRAAARTCLAAIR